MEGSDNDKRSEWDAISKGSDEKQKKIEWVTEDFELDSKFYQRDQCVQL